MTDVFVVCCVVCVVCCICVFRLRQPPQTLEELGESLKLLKALQGDLTKTEAQISVVHDQFAILDKYEVPVEQTVSNYYYYCYCCH